MHKALLRPLLLLSLLAVLTACGDQPTREPLSREDAQELKSNILEANKYLVAALGNPTNIVTTSTVGGQVFPAPVASLILASGLDAQSISCNASTSPSNPQDLDGDGIPLQATFSVDCRVESTYLKGKITLRDQDDNNRKSGYALDTDQYELSFNTGTANQSGLKLDLDVDLNWRNPNYDIRYNFYFEAYKPGKRYSQRYNYTAEYVPDDPERPFVGGTFNYRGALEYRTPSRYYLLQGLATNLRYLRSCTSTFVGGSFSLTDSQGNRLDVVYNGCGNVTVTYNGEAL
ncbi:hypothetical protein [Meiothermus taiwanensis]|jgi:hypothetical protein|uniref:Lipoprotein n=1 Tax=Meiothermus taiwanensis WR-220 TaxID=1339250 RepID=A0ABM6WG85_9DEIN|nr:hypothetical protein [Meiothermus taiwanensis]AWR85903.1 hypothetical protein Mtai_v1c06560 [Meiothermus taiwanensis WR-220]KIQ53805.1 hypothetical protein SY28_11920 [Meiothermus taiwanensis]KZK15095.1 hypothetical protein A3962_11580 [Meiothermus taiwanensis]